MKNSERGVVIPFGDSNFVFQQSPVVVMIELRRYLQR